MFCAAMLAGCSRDAKIKEIIDTANYNSKQSEQIANEVDAISNKIATTETLSRVYRIDAEHKGCGQIQTSFATLLITTDSAEPYLDGYKLKLRVGNPTSMLLSGLTVRGFWPDASKKGLTQRDYSLTSDLAPGVWSPIEIVMAPATADDMRRAAITIGVERVEMRDSRN